jgi:hypothetical protein
MNNKLIEKIIINSFKKILFEDNIIDIIISSCKTIILLYPDDKLDDLLEFIVNIFFDILDKLPKKKKIDILKKITKELIVLSIKY